MPAAWRILKKRHLQFAFDGEAARQYGGRWNSPGTSVVYTSETRALCLLEVLAGLRSVKPIEAYVLIPVRFHDATVIGVDRNDLAADWRRSPPPPTMQQIGDDWVQRQRSAVLRVPSAIVPEESNYLLNPAHQDFGRIEIGPPEDILIDSRLLR